MWALSLYDKNSDKLILCRDRVGVKPLYYYKSNEFFMYSSELKGLMAHSCFYKEINKKSLASFFKYGYVNAPHSIFENTYKVRPGEYIVIDQSGVIIMKKYWDLGDHLVKELPVKVKTHILRS